MSTVQFDFTPFEFPWLWFLVPLGLAVVLVIAYFAARDESSPLGVAAVAAMAVTVLTAVSSVIVLSVRDSSFHDTAMVDALMKQFPELSLVEVVGEDAPPARLRSGLVYDSQSREVALRAFPSGKKCILSTDSIKPADSADDHSSLLPFGEPVTSFVWRGSLHCT